MDVTTGEVLLEYNADEKLFPASVTKIMTMLLVMEAIQDGKISLTDIVVCSEIASKKGGSQIWLEPNEEMTVNDLLKATAIGSANDAATLLGEYISGSEEAFINLMNERAKELGMNNTHFENSSGLDESGEENYSTVYDMALLMKYANNLFDFKEIDSTKKIVVETNKNVYSWTNKNKLLFLYKYCNGGKTGYTKKAKRTLVTSASKDEVNLICVTFIDKDDFNTHKMEEIMQFTAEIGIY